MSIIITDGNDCCEKQLINNWAAEFAKRAISEHRGSEVIDHPNGSVTTEKIKDGAIVSNKLGNQSVDKDKLADRCVTTDKIEDYVITLNKLTNNSVNGSKIVSGSINTTHLMNDCVETRKIADGAVTPEKLDRGYLPAQENPFIDENTGPANNELLIFFKDIMINLDGDEDSVYSYKFYNGYIKNSEGTKYKWKSPIFEGGVKTSDIADGTVTPQKTSFCNYSTTPTQIGTWIDGTPIWRVAFDVSLTGTELTYYSILYSELLQNKLSCVNDGRIIFPLNQYIIAYDNESGIDIMDSSFCVFSNGGLIEWDMQRQKMYGYVEFATPQSNIKEV